MARRVWNRGTRVVGLTGDMGSGKSTVAKLFEELGAAVYDSDSRAKILLNTEDVRNTIENRFAGMPFSFYKNGVYDVNAAKELLFNGYKYKPEGILAAGLRLFKSDKAKEVSFTANTIRERFNNAIRSHVTRDFYQWAEARADEGAKLVMFESAILHEMDLKSYFEFNIFVTCETETAKERVRLRSGLSSEEYDKRMSLQISPSDKLGAYYSDWIIHNEKSTTVDQLRAQVKSIYNLIV